MPKGGDELSRLIDLVIPGYHPLRKGDVGELAPSVVRFELAVESAM
jgi:hypothetical protein